MNIFEKSKIQDSEPKLFIWIIVFFVFPIVCVLLARSFLIDFMFQSTKTKAIVVGIDTLKSYREPGYSYAPILEFTTKKGIKIIAKENLYSYPINFKLGETKSIYYLNSDPQHIFEFTPFTIGILIIAVLIIIVAAFVFVGILFPKSSISKLLTKYLI